MSKVFKAVAAVASIAAMIPGPHVPFAAAIAAVATVGAAVTAKKPTPIASGSINRMALAKEAPSPYLIGRTYYAGIVRHDAGYGATLKKVPNPYRGMVVEYGVGGPYDSLEGMYADFAALTFSGNAATGYYAGYMYRDTQLGALTETALTAHYVGFPNWTSNHILSGKPAILWNLLFDKDGKRYASGLPQLGAVWKGARVYDPRLDSTYPGGSGAHRITDEATWTWSACPGLNGLAYAYGRYKNGILVFGVGLPATGIEIADFVTLANVCDANAWTCGGVLFEPGDRWNNLKQILEAAAAEPLFRGAKLGVKICAPHVALDTITDADLADDDAEIPAGQTWRKRLNGIFPKYRSEDHHWEYVTTAEPVVVADYVTADGEEKKEERQWNLVQDADQVTMLAAYELVNARELEPIVLVCKPHMRGYGPGDMLTLDLADNHGLDIDAIILTRRVDPGSLKVTFTLASETTAKHAFALGLTGTPPPTPELVSGEDRDEIAVATTVAAEIVDQGAGATSDSLAALDPTAAVQLAALVAGRIPETVAIDDGTPTPISVSMTAGQTVGVTARAGGTADVGAILYVNVNVRPSGGSDTLLFVENVTGDGSYQTVSGMEDFTNTTGVTTTFEFRGAAGFTLGSGTFDPGASDMTV